MLTQGQQILMLTLSSKHWVQEETGSTKRKPMLIVDKAIYQAEDAASDKVNLNQDKAETQIKLVDFYIFVSSYHLTTTE